MKKVIDVVLNDGDDKLLVQLMLGQNAGIADFPSGIGVVVSRNRKENVIGTCLLNAATAMALFQHALCDVQCICSLRKDGALAATFSFRQSGEGAIMFVIDIEGRFVFKKLSPKDIDDLGAMYLRLVFASLAS